MSAVAPLSTSGVFAYAAGSLATGVFATVPTVLLLYFCTDVLMLSAVAAAAIVVIPKIWAIVWDPLVGAWSDRAVTRIGRRRPFLVVGLAGVPLSFAMVFSPPALAVSALILWVGVSYFALTTLYSLYAVPYVAIPAEIGEDARQRRRLVTARMVVSMVGVLVGGGVAPVLVGVAGGGREGYMTMAAIVAVACAVFMSGPLFMLRGRDSSRAPLRAGPSRLWLQLNSAWRDRRFRWQTKAYIAQLTAAGMVSSAAPYLVTRAWQRPEADVGVAMMLMLGATAVSIQLWSWAGRRWGEQRSLVAAVICFAGAVAALGTAASMHVEWTVALPLFALAGVPFAGLQVLPYTIAAHLIHDASSNGSANEGVFTGVWTAAEKLGLALGPGATALALAVLGNAATAKLAVFVALAPSLLALISLPLLLKAQGQPTDASGEQAATAG